MGHVPSKRVGDTKNTCLVPIKEFEEQFGVTVTLEEPLA